MPSASPPPSPFFVLRLLVRARRWSVAGAGRIAFALAVLLCLALSSTALGGRSESFAESDEEASLVDEANGQDDADDQDEDGWHLASMRRCQHSRDVIEQPRSAVHFRAAFFSNTGLHVLFCRWLN